MEAVSKNLRFLRKAMGYTQEQFAEKLAIKRSLLGAYEEGRSNPNYKVLLKTCEMFNVSMEDMLNKDLSGMFAKKLKEGATKPEELLMQGQTKILTVTVSDEGRENIEMVSQKASAGYLSGFADEEFIRELPKFRLPFLNNGTFRAFEIKGDSMLPVQSGSIIIGEYVEQVQDIKDGATYIVVSKSDGIVYKRVFKSDDESKIYLHSDNKAYQPIPLNLENLLEIWKVVLIISKPNEDKHISSDQLMHMIVELQNEVLRLKSHPTA